MYRQEFEELSEPSVPADLESTREREQLALALKRSIDIVGALVFFTLFLPLFLAVCAGVKVTSRGPIFYVQHRVGRGGRLFRFYKFRSMVVDADAALARFLDSDQQAMKQWSEFQKLEHDPRVTPFGRLIRRASLDELPQFWNVLKGDMSLVGPRPCMPQQEGYYGRYWRHYCAMRPGLTGLWQVSGRNRLSYRNRVDLDARYVSTWSLGLDARILLRTFRAVVSGDGSR